MIFDKFKFTPRQLEVATLVAHKFSNKEIADKMCISVKGVKFHLTDIYRKMNLKNRMELVRYWINEKYKIKDYEFIPLDERLPKGL